MSRFLVYGLSNGVGGVESIVLNMCKILSMHHTFDLLISTGECAYQDVFEKYPSISRLNATAWGASRRQFREDVTNILKQAKYDYVWFNGCIMSNLDLWILTKKYSSAKTIAHSHGSSFEEKNKIKRIILLLLHYLNRPKFNRLTDIPCMCSIKSGEWFYGKEYMCMHSVFMINNGIKADSFKYDEAVRSKYREKLGIEKDTYVLFHAGRLTQVKNQKFIIDIMYHLKNKRDNALLLIAGSGPLKTELELYAHTLGLGDYIKFLGNRTDVAQLYQAADCFVLSSFHEGFPVTLIEAQTSGLPCFVSKNVTTEVKVCENVHFLDIVTQTASDWADCIVNNIQKNNDRHTSYLAVINRKFLIEQVCEDFVSHLIMN